MKTGDPDVGQHRLQRRPVVTLPAGDDERQRPAVPTDPGMNLGAQPATRPSDAVTCRFTLRQGQILVVRDCPCVLFRAGRVRRMLVGGGDRGIHADPPVNFPASIRLGQQPVPGAVPGVATVALPRRLPPTEHLPRQVTPGNPGPIPADDSLRHLAVVAERVAPPTRVRRQQRLDPLPLLITQRAKPRPSPRHPSRLPPATSQIRETRASWLAGCCGVAWTTTIVSAKQPDLA